MNRPEKTKKLIIAVALTTVTFLFFNFFYAYHLFFKEQTQLFLFSSTYLFSYFDKPAWLAALSGDFLTQFFYLRGGGPAVLAALFVTEWFLAYSVIKKISKSKFAAIWAFFPVATDFVSHLSLAHNARISVGFILTLLLFLVYGKIKNRSLSLAFAFLVALSGYWFLGSSVVVFPFLVLLSDKDLKRIFLHLPLLPFVFVLPFILRAKYLLPINETLLFPAILLKSLLPLSALILAAFAAVIFQKNKHFFPVLTETSIATILLLLIIVFGINSNAGFKREKIFALDTETYFGKIDKVIELAEKSKMESRFVAYYTNMALAKKGELPNRLLGFYQPAVQGLILPVSQNENWQTILFSNELFYLLGDMNLAQHSAMLGNTFSPYQRSSRMMKRLAEINMVNGDYPSAEKFLRILDHTLFHKKWAQQKFSENNANCNSSWLLEKRAQVAHSDTIRNSYDYIQSIEFLVQQNPENLIALDYLLSFYLLNKDLVSFKTAYDKYAKLLKRPVPKLYAEALLIKLFQDKVSQEEVLTYRIDSEQMRKFAEYTNIFEKARGNIDQLKTGFEFTYWFYYHFATFKEN
ncbi:DUF6057 family protein [uncultured Draconibacterium sp.]|uniref:DUF6057 family protein n=1 Tax=uncultured Draconibacterium sp. TaxID=1573823 RepID=UPI0032166DEA